MSTLDTIKYIVDALRTQKPIEPGITREPGQIPRRMAGPLFGNPLTGMHNDINYSRYVKMTHDMGEEPVSYEEWKKDAT